MGRRSSATPVLTSYGRTTDVSRANCRPSARLRGEGRDQKPPEPQYEWVGFSLLCNATPTAFVLNGEEFYSIDSFYQAQAALCEKGSV